MLGGSKTQRAEDAQCIFLEAGRGITDAADDLVCEILASAKRIDKPLVRMVCHSIDGEITPGEILGDIADEVHAVGVAVIGILAVDAESCHLIWHMVDNDGQRAVLQAGFNHVAAAEDLLHFLRQGGGADIIIAGRVPHQCIADAAADGIGGVSGAGEAVQHKERAIWERHHFHHLLGLSIIEEEKHICKGEER